jgi:hypothetical protein
MVSAFGNDPFREEWNRSVWRADALFGEGEE